MTAIESGVWGGKEYDISQGFGEYNPQTAWMYKYAADYGWAAGTHIGLDVAVPKFTPIYAAQPGVVKQSGPSDSFRPNPVIITEDDGDEAIYGHLWESVVPPEKKVKAGTLLGYSGEQTVRGTMTPDGTGPHIHFELRRPDEVTGGMKAVNPYAELTGAPDYSKPGDEYNKDGGLGQQYGFGLPSTEQVQSAGMRAGLFLVGAVIIVAGAWALIGAPTNVTALAKDIA